MTSAFKKANVGIETVLIIVVLLGIAIIMPIAYMTLSDINTDIQADDDLSNETKEVSNDLYLRMPSFLDGLFVFVLVLLWILVVATSLFIDSHPVFFVISIILLIFVLFVGAVAGNTYEEFMADTDMAVYTGTFPMTYWLMTHFIPVIIVIAFSVVIALFAKNKFMGGTI